MYVVFFIIPREYLKNADECDFIIVGKESVFIFSCDINLILKNSLLLNNMNKIPKKSTKNEKILKKSLINSLVYRDGIIKGLAQILCK